jgi:hypothetical protein
MGEQGFIFKSYIGVALRTFEPPQYICERVIFINIYNLAQHCEGSPYSTCQWLKKYTYAYNLPIRATPAGLLLEPLLKK